LLAETRAPPAPVLVDRAGLPSVSRAEALFEQLRIALWS
jgi:hypothetical protein